MNTTIDDIIDYVQRGEADIRTNSSAPFNYGGLRDLLVDFQQNFCKPDVMRSLPEASREQLISDLDDKRIFNLSNIPADIYYLSRKEIADYLLDKYIIAKRQ